MSQFYSASEEEDDLESAEIDERLAVIVAGLADRHQLGDSIDIVEECKRYPEFAEELRSLWGTIVVTEAVGAVEAVAIRSGSDKGSGTWQLPLPYQFGDFEIRELLGRGGMGIVYRAQQISLDREVAIKMILKDQLATQQDRQRFFAEARATAKLEHPGIVPVYDVGEIDGRPYFVMKLIKGRTLYELIQDGNVTPRIAARYMEQICRAVQFAHERGIVHRDIKPSNILIDETGHARLTDFGLAKVSDSMDSLTKTGVVLGTPTYMSPEQASGRLGPIGPASDVYSLGSVLYHSITGRPPFIGKNPVDLVFKILEQDPPLPRVLAPHVDRDLEMIAVRALQKPQDLRYRSADAMGDDLLAYLRDEPISARSGQFAQIIARYFRETHHAPVLENWGLLWMWHSLVLILVCVLTEILQWNDVNRWTYPLLWTVGLGAWAGVFWALRRRMGPVTFVERQIAHVWGASMIAIASLFPIEWALNLRPLQLTPLLGVISGMIFLIKAGILSGVFYIQAVCLFATTGLMLAYPSVAHLIFGAVAATSFFVPGLKYYKQSLTNTDP
ncbi:serine/threonine-protein kinase [Pirellulaceae bacterium SH449]